MKYREVKRLRKVRKMKNIKTLDQKKHILWFKVLLNMAL